MSLCYFFVICTQVRAKNEDRDRTNEKTDVCVGDVVSTFKRGSVKEREFSV